MKRILFAIVSMAIAATAQGQWTSTPNTTGKTVIFNNNRLIAGGTGGAYVSDDNGTSFSLSNNGLPGTALSNFFPRAVVGNNIFAMSDRVYKSSDNCSSWTLASTGLQTTSTISYIYYDGTTLYTTFQDGKVYTSTDLGATWTLKGNVGTYIVVIRAYNGLLYAGTSSLGIYSSADGGATWTTANTGISAGDRQVYGMGVHDNVLFMGSYSGKIYKWNTATNDWTMIHSAGSPIRSFLVSGNALMVATDGGFIYTTDNGSNWQTNNIGLVGTDLYFLEMATSDQYIFAGLFNGGVKRHTLADLGITGTSVAQLAAGNLAVNVFPNPAQNTLQLEVKDASFTGYEIYSVTGQVVLAGKLRASNDMVNISPLAKGSYYIQLYTNKATTVKSFIKE